jgi:hypothetical protein
VTFNVGVSVPFDVLTQQLVSDGHAKNNALGFSELSDGRSTQAVIASV